MLTLNQTIEILKNFSLKHKALGKGTSNAHFYFGDKWEVNDNDDLQYPLMWVSLLPTVPDKSGLVTRKFQIDISDKVNLDESNETHVLSDTEQICFDLLNYLEQVADTGDIGMLLGSNSELTDYTEDRDDQVSGWFFTVEIKSHQNNTSCNLPINSGSILDYTYIYVGNDLANGFTVEIKDQDGNIIQTFTSSGEYVINSDSVMIEQEEIEYDGNPITLSDTPVIMLNAFAGASPIFVTDDYTIAGNVITINPSNPFIEIGTKLRFTYTK